MVGGSDIIMVMFPVLSVKCGTYIKPYRLQKNL